MGQIRVTLVVASRIHASSWVVICAAKYLNLQFPTILINGGSLAKLFQSTDLIAPSYQNGPQKYWTGC
jgi:hypothetical protein